MQHPIRPHMNARELATHLSVPVGTVKRWLHEGLPATRLRNGREVSIDLADALKWVETFRPHSVAFNRQSLVLGAARGLDGAVWVGFTGDVERRLRELRKMTRTTIALVFALPGDAGMAARIRQAISPVEKAEPEQWFTRKSVEELLRTTVLYNRGYNRTGSSAQQRVAAEAEPESVVVTDPVVKRIAEVARMFRLSK